MAALTPNEVTLQVARAFEKLGVGYYLCGSFASGLRLKRAGLSEGYMRRWAKALSVGDLLERALTAASK